MFETLPKISVTGLSTRECGPENAPTICFLHAGGIGGWMWTPQIEALQNTYHCLIPDLPEHGLSAGTRPFTIKDAASRVAELISKKAHKGRAHVIGLSEGAQLSVQLLSTASHIIDHAIVSSALLHPIPGLSLKEHGWNLHKPELFNSVVRDWLTDQPLPAALIPLTQK